MEYSDHFADFGDDFDAEGEPLLEHEEEAHESPYLGSDPHHPYYARYSDEHDAANGPPWERSRWVMS